MTEADTNTRLSPDLERTLRSYVRGDLEEAVRSELEELLITDPDTFEALGVVEDELLEEYLDGLGKETDRLAFEQHFLATPARAARLRFARALRACASGGSAAEPHRPQLRVVRPPRWPPAWIGLAAALMASVGGNFWLASVNFSTREEESLPPPVVVTPVPVGDEAARVQELQDRLGREQAERSSAEARVESLAETFRLSRAVVATFTLAAGVLRSGGSIQRVAVPGGTVVVRLRLELAGDDYPRYRAALLDAEGDEVWVASKLKAETEAGQTAIVLDLPVGLLPRGDYQVKLGGLAEREEREAVGTYAFRVTP